MRIAEAGMDVVVLISADAEWREVLSYYKDPTVHTSPVGPFFIGSIAGNRTVLFNGGWGKVAASASTQYTIDRWNPKLIVNIGTCGGFESSVNLGDVILVEETIIYDIHERMTDPAAAMNFYSTKIDLSYLCEPFPQPVIKGRLLSADQDIDPALVYKLTSTYAAMAADWESGAIAWIAHRNRVKTLILRGVSDLVNSFGGEIYNSDVFSDRSKSIMIPLLKSLPNWLRCASWGNLK